MITTLVIANGLDYCITTSYNKMKKPLGTILSTFNGNHCIHSLRPPENLKYTDKGERLWVGREKYTHFWNSFWSLPVHTRERWSLCFVSSEAIVYGITTWHMCEFCENKTYPLRYHSLHPTRRGCLNQDVFPNWDWLFPEWVQKNQKPLFLILCRLNLDCSPTGSILLGIAGVWDFSRTLSM